MFWNGSNWVDEGNAAARPRRVNRRRKLREWLITSMMIAGLVALPLLPLSTTSAASPPVARLSTDWSDTHVVRTFQEDHARLKREGAWKRGEDKAFLRGRAVYSREPGARLHLAFNGTGVALIGAVGPKQGEARIYIDERLVKTVDTYAASFSASQILFRTTWKTTRMRTLTVEVAGTKGHPTVTVDAVLIRGKVQEKRAELAAKPPTRVAAPKGNADAPIISAIAASAIGRSDATVAWTLNEYGTGQVEYGTTSKYGSQTAKESSFTWNYHIQTLSGLAQGTLYHYRVRSEDAEGHMSISPDQTFTTLTTGTIEDAAPTPAATAVPTAAPTAPTVPAPTTTVAYGSAVGADTLANTTTDQGPVSFRFIADRSTALTGIRVYFEVGAGYSAGDGGSRVVTLETDASGKPSGTVLASTTHVGLPSGSTRFVTLTVPANLIQGQAYHIVFTNSGGGYVSVNAMLSWQSDPVGQPTFAGWQVLRNGTIRHGFIPVLELHWADGSKSGNGYINAFERNLTAIGGANNARERFTPTRDITFSQIGIRLMRDAAGNDANLTLRLAGVSGEIPAAAIPIVAPANWNTSNQTSAWAVVSVPSTTLRAGTSNTLEMSAPAGITYRAQALQKGSGYGFSAFFRDGYAEMSTDSGGSWTGVQGWSGPDNGYDLQWFLR